MNCVTRSYSTDTRVLLPPQRPLDTGVGTLCGVFRCHNVIGQVTIIGQMFNINIVSRIEYFADDYNRLTVLNPVEWTYKRKS